MHAQTSEDALRECFKCDGYHNKQQLIKNNFFPVLGAQEKKDFLSLLEAQKNKGELRAFDIQIDQKSWEEFMSIYYSKYKHIKRKWYPVQVKYIDKNHEESLSGRIKTKGNSSTQSLKVGFRFKINKKKKFTGGIFSKKKQIYFRHLEYDQTGVNEASYFKGYNLAYESVLWQNNIPLEGDFFWVLINGEPYGYYYVMDIEKEWILKNVNKNFNEENDCLIKAKTWADYISANLEFYPDFWNINYFSSIYRIEEGKKKNCHKQVIALMKDIEREDITSLQAKFFDLREVLFYTQYIYKTKQRTGIHQNYLLLKHNGKWRFLPWDGDLSFDTHIDFSLKEIYENKLFRLVRKHQRALFPEELRNKIMQFDYKNFVKGILFNNYRQYYNALSIDRRIWRAYSKKDDVNIDPRYQRYYSIGIGKSWFEAIMNEVFDNVMQSWIR